LISGTTHGSHGGDFKFNHDLRGRELWRKEMATIWLLGEKEVCCAEPAGVSIGIANNVVDA
jgi:hypothetical protein